jgi:hypothetical protein
LLHSLHSILLNAEEDFGTALLNSMSSSEQHNTLHPAVREFATTIARREAAASNNSYYAGKQPRTSTQHVSISRTREISSHRYKGV